MLYRRRLIWCVAMLLGSAVSAGCALQKPTPKAPPSPAPGQAAPAPAPVEETEAPAATEAAPAAPAPAARGLGGAPAAGGAAAEKSVALDDLLGQLDAAEGMALAAGQDCAGACRALKSMGHAAAGICSLAPRPDSTGRCRNAEERVRAAREKVRSACKQCADGPELDPNAPVQ